MNQNYLNKISVFDIDGTLIEGQIQEEFIAFLREKKIVSVFYSLRIKIWFVLYKLGFVKDVKDILNKAVQYFKDKDVDEISILIDEFFTTRVRNKIFSGSRTLIESLNNSGHKILILSTVVEPIVKRVADEFKINEYLCTSLEIVNNKYTGRVNGSAVYGKEKSNKLIEYFTSNSLKFSDAVAYADHESDLEFMKLCGASFFVNPTMKIKQLAQKFGIGIIDMRSI